LTLLYVEHIITTEKANLEKSKDAKL